MNKRGYTLMEILVVVIIIGILAAIGLPQYANVVEKQKATDAIYLLATIANSQERYYAVNEAYTTDYRDLDGDWVDYNTKLSPTGAVYTDKFFTFTISGPDEERGKVTAQRRGSNTYKLERINATGVICCKAIADEYTDICDLVKITNTCS
jgi:prepilin-type N-terminal cleavage/methylation domain-containing protein